MGIFDRFKPGSKQAPDTAGISPSPETGQQAPDAATADVTPPAGAGDETMPLPLEEIEAALAAAAVPAVEAAVPPSGPLAPERITDPGDLPFLGRRPGVIPDHHGDPMESMGNIFDVAILLAVGFLVVSLSSFGLSDLLGKGDVTIVKNPGTKGMELVTKKNGVIERMRTTTSQAEGVGAAIGTVYKLENGEIVWVPGVPGAGRTTGPGTGTGIGTTPGATSPGVFAPSGSTAPSGTVPQGGIGADGPSLP